MRVLLSRRFVVRLAVLLALAGWFAAVPPVIGGEFEDAVRARWRGAWVVIDTEIYSDCDGRYKTNKVSGRLVTSGGDLRFEGGELAKVDKVQVKRKKAELHATLDVKRLIPYRDGPFTLYSERVCQVQFHLQVPKEITKAKDADAVDAMLGAVVDRHDSREDAYDSDLWNGREMDAYPDDYALTLARHAVWKAEQFNSNIDTKLHEALDRATALAQGLLEDPEYMTGFASGARAMRAWSERDCKVLVGRDFPVVRRPIPSSDAGRDDTWKQGYDHGQQLVYSLALLERLGACYVEVPPLPDGAAQAATASR